MIVRPLTGGRTVWITAAVLCILILLSYQFHDYALAISGFGSITTPDGPDSVQEVASTANILPCKTLSGAEDVVVVLKTGSTEIQDKLPVHLSTTLRCYPHYLVLSDLDESFEGQSVLDALADVSPEIKETHGDFALYRQLREHGRGSLKPEDLSGPESHSQGSVGMPSNPGWVLDKWKFLPMMRRTLQEKPEQKWYVFVETDTYVLWKNLLAYLDALDWTKPHYFGSQMQLGDILFAHGGSGYVISRTSLEHVVGYYKEHKQELEQLTDQTWAGDAVLGKALKNAGTPLGWVWPIFQGEAVDSIDYSRIGYDRRLWCYPAVSYHHLSPSAVQDLWNFEQAWLETNGKVQTSILRQKDMFEEYLLPRVAESQADWDNLADEDQKEVSTLDECRAECEAHDRCLQYTLHPDGHCYTTTRAKVGRPRLGVQSGWVMQRVQDYHDQMDPCHDEGWIM